MSNRSDSRDSQSHAHSHVHPKPAQTPESAPAHEASAALPTSQDLATLDAQPKPPHEASNASYTLCEAVTPAVLGVLTGPTLAGYLGSAFDASQLATVVPAAQQDLAALRRFENAVALKKRAMQPAAMVISEHVGLLMKRWSEFEAAHPTEARALTPLREAWQATHARAHHHAAPAAGGQGAASGQK